MHADLCDALASRRPTVEISQHPAFEFAGADEPLFDNDLGIVRLRDLDGFLKLRGLVDLGDAQT